METKSQLDSAVDEGDFAKVRFVCYNLRCLLDRKLFDTLFRGLFLLLGDVALFFVRFQNDVFIPEDNIFVTEMIQSTSGLGLVHRRVLSLVRKKLS